MMKDVLIVCDATPYLDASTLDSFVASLPLPRQSRILEGKNLELHALRAAQEEALKTALEQMGEDYSSLEIAYAEWGKPFVVGRSNLSISLSHRHRYACAYVAKVDVGDIRCGVDIERVVPLSERYQKLSHRFLLDIPLTSPLDFFTAWTKTECLVKLTGEGMKGAKHLPDTTHMTLSHQTLTHPNGDTYLVCTAYEVGIAFS